MEFCSFKLGAGLGAGCRMLRRLGALISAVLVCCGCPVHQWPEAYPDLPEKLMLRLHYETDFWIWEHLYDPKQNEYPVELYPDADFDAAHPGTTEVYDNRQSSGLMDIRVRVYNRTNLSNCVAEYDFVREVSFGYDCEVELELDEGNYEIVVWSHLLESSGTQPFYAASDLRSIGLIDDNYAGSTDLRDGFRGRTGFEFSTETRERAVCEVEMRRPMAKFEFVTTDLSEFLDAETVRRSLPTRASAEDYEVVISYPFYYPNAYNAIVDDIASGSGYRFSTSMSVTGESEASMGFDYVFINDIADGRVQVQVTVLDLYGQQVANSQIIMLPVRRDCHTVLRGAFLSMGASGGVGIDPDYEGDHNIVFR